MSDDEMGPRRNTRSSYVRSPRMYESQDDDEVDHVEPVDDPLAPREDVGHDELDGADDQENSSVADVFNAELPNDELAAHEDRQYLPGEPVPAPPAELLTQKLAQPRTIRSRKITLKMVSADHVWSIKQEGEHRVELKVMRSIDDLHTEYEQVIEQQRIHFLSRGKDRHSSRGSSRTNGSSSSSRSAKKRSPKAPPSQFPQENDKDQGATTTKQMAMSTTTPSMTMSETSTEDSAPVGWIDVQSSDRELLLPLCEMFHLHSSTIDSIIELDHVEKVEHYHSLGYFFMNVVVPTLTVKKGGVQSNVSSSQDAVFSCVSCVVFSKLIITIHRKPFPGLLETVREVKRRFAFRHRRLEQRVPSDARSVISRSDHVYAMMRVGWVLTNIVSNAVFSSIPDPTVLLQQVNELDESVVLSASQGSLQGQRQLLQKISMFRRRVLKERNSVASKEQFLGELLGPVCRTTYLTCRTSDAELIKQALAYAARTLSRLEAGHDALSSAQANLLSVLSLSQNRAAHETDEQVQLLGIVTVIGIAPVVITATMGMNVSVPFMISNGYVSLDAFYVLVSIIGAWFVVGGFFMMRGKIRQLIF